jgi:pyruvate/2-oxoglutarate dehydrogenase complex dihydrolipoamide acyltransferase (E2) component
LRTLCLELAGLLLTAVAAYERRAREPMIDPEILTIPTVTITNLTTLLVNFGVFGALLMVPAIAVEPQGSRVGGLGHDATTAGMILAPGCLAMLVVGPVCGG